MPRTSPGRPSEAMRRICRTPRSRCSGGSRDGWGPPRPSCREGSRPLRSAEGCRGPRSCCRARARRGRETKRGKGPQGIAPADGNPGTPCRAGASLNSTQGNGPVSGDRLCPERGERPDPVDRFPGERNAFRNLNSGRRRRPGSHGISGTRDGEEDHGDGNNPPEEGAFHASFMEKSSGVQSVLPRCRRRAVKTLSRCS